MSSTAVGPVYDPSQATGALVPGGNLTADVINQSISAGTWDAPVQASVDPEAMQASAGSDTATQPNTGFLSVLQTVIGTAGALTAAAISGPKKIQPGAGAPNPARPGIFGGAAAGSIQTILIVGAVVLIAVAAFKALEKRRS